MDADIDRRNVLRAIGGGGIGLLLAPGVLGMTGFSSRQDTDKEKQIGPAEDLMREHGVLSRILLIYEEGLRRLASATGELKPDALRNAAEIIQQFIGQYHEKLEEDYIFPRFEKAGKLTDLVKTLREQHDAGRRVNDVVFRSATDAAFKNVSDRKQLTAALQQFIRMYRPHKAREDTVLFPALHDIVSAGDYAAMGEAFENKEHQLFGEKGFEKMVDRVAGIEKSLGINDLSKFTPNM